MKQLNILESVNGYQLYLTDAEPLKAVDLRFVATDSMKLGQLVSEIMEGVYDESFAQSEAPE